MTGWSEHTLTELALDERRRHASAAAGVHAVPGAPARPRLARRRPATPTLQRRLGVLLVETGLHLITRAGAGSL
jgi:hypothetical protein